MSSRNDAKASIDSACLDEGRWAQQPYQGWQMSPFAITAEQAIAQGSSWSQMLSVAKFHEKEIDRLLSDNLNPSRIAKLSSQKAYGVKRAANAAIERHRASVHHFKTIASAIRSSRI